LSCSVENTFKAVFGPPVMFMLLSVNDYIYLSKRPRPCRPGKEDWGLKVEIAALVLEAAQLLLELLS